MSVILPRTSPVAFSTVAPAYLGGVGVLWRVLMTLRTMSLGLVPKADVASIGNGVSRILFWASIGQIGKMIIERVAVKMTNPGSRLAFWTRANERQCHEVMNHSLPATYLDLGIATTVTHPAHADREVTASRPSTTTGADHSCPALVDEVAGKAWNFTKFIHPQIIAVT